MARECYSASMKQKTVDNIYLDELDMRDEVLTRPDPSEELEPVLLDDDPEHLAYISSKLAEDLKNLLIHFLRQNKDVFAWKQADMRGIDPTVITHRLNVSPSFKPIKQKRRSFAPERQKTINEEVASLPQPVGGGKIGNHQRSAGTPRKIQKALGCLLRAKKVKEQGYDRNTEPPLPKENQQTNQNTPTIGRELRRTYIEVLQNPFYEGMQWEAKTVIEGHFEEAHHLRHRDHIEGQNVRGPHPNAKERLIKSGKGGPI